MAIFDKVDYIEIEHAQLFVMLGSRVFRNDPRVIKNEDFKKSSQIIMYYNIIIACGDVAMLLCRYLCVNFG